MIITGIEKDEYNTNVYPNPSNGTFNLKTNLTGNIAISLINTKGQTINSENLNNTGTAIPLNFETVPGLYLMTIEKKGVKISKKIVIE